MSLGCVKAANSTPNAIIQKLMGPGAATDAMDHADAVGSITSIAPNGGVIICKRQGRLSIRTRRWEQVIAESSRARRTPTLEIAGDGGVTSGRTSGRQANGPAVLGVRTLLQLKMGARPLWRLMTNRSVTIPAALLTTNGTVGCRVKKSADTHEMTIRFCTPSRK